MNNRFVQIGRYDILNDHQDYGSFHYLKDQVNELVDMRTGIVYMDCCFGGDYNCHQLQPMLYDNGKPKHLNKEELLKIRMMIDRLDYSSSKKAHLYNDYRCNNYKDMIRNARNEWTLEEIYNEVFPDSEDRARYELAYKEKLNSK